MNNSDIEPVQIETDLFIFETPNGWTIETLGEEAELEGENGEFMVVASYSLDEKPSDELTKALKENISQAMNEAAQDPELSINRPVKSDKSTDGFPVLSLLAQTDSDTNEYFDQYAVIGGSTAVLITVEGSIQHRSSSAFVEEAIYDTVFK